MNTTHSINKIVSVASMMGAITLGAITLSLVTVGSAATATKDSTGQYVDDTGITAKVKSALLNDEQVKSFEIKVETMKGVVQLSGFVDNADQKRAAGKDTTAIPGVTDVVNNLIVK